GFSLSLQKMSKAERRAKVEEAARVLGLTEHLGRKPAQLSGGQRQRVAMGRAIVRSPAAFLMDEPLSKLDAHGTTVKLGDQILDVPSALRDERVSGPYRGGRLVVGIRPEHLADAAH